MIRKIAAVLSLVLAMPGVASALPADSVSALLAKREECVHFRWEANPDDGSKIASISLPVTLNGRNFWFQLDTGTQTDILYGDIADKAGWAKDSEDDFRATEMRIGSVSIDRPLIALFRKEPIQETSGEVGLADLTGRVTVIDYPGQLFCIFSPASAPPEIINNTKWIRGAVQGGHFFVPIATRGFFSPSIIFDTGSSEIPLSVNFSKWQAITGLASLSDTPFTLNLTAFSKPVILSGALSQDSLKLSDIDLGRQVVYVNKGRPEAFGEELYQSNGFMGNVAFLEKIIVLNLGDGNTKFGIVNSGLR